MKGENGEEKGKKEGNPNESKGILTKKDSTYIIISIVILFVLSTLLTLLIRAIVSS